MLVIVALLIGSLVPIQALINSRLAVSLGHPMYGAFFNFIIGGACIIGLLAVLRLPMPLKAAWGLPWYLFLGGLIGTSFVLSAIFIVPRIGAAAFIGSVLVGQLVMSMLADHFGFFGFARYPLGWSRVAGMILLISGLLMVLRRQP